LDAASGLELSPWPAVHGKEVPRNPNTEVTGEKDKSNQIHDLEELKIRESSHKSALDLGFPHGTGDNYKYDPKTYTWRAWMMVAVIPDD
jgi:hypothetical protein